ncbi:brevican core protein isoform X1 [Oncorhynchus tshawytscha]|uniref:Brevican core protein-like n=2 Tax=Oncorhynchus tshawytscha TaxID=74940 RepID=A0A8C8EZ76_ONCTS|nr:brevican core protein isoform X1 [Oncorhynchus tshawytscha]
MFVEIMRPVRFLPLLCTVCHLTMAFPTQTGYSEDDKRQLQVTISKTTPISTAHLGGSITITCLVSLSPGPPSSSSPPIPPRVKWSVLHEGELEETEILVARGQRVKVNEAYRERASLVNFADSPEDLSLWLGELRSSDTGHYRCEVQQGLDDASDFTQIKVKGVVFHYRHASGRYAFSFSEAQRSCEGIGAHIATPDQLLAAYYDGYEQCDAGWLADQSVRYPIQVPREGCYGDMDGRPGLRNYGTLESEELFDVYCYVEHIDGEVFHGSAPQQLSLDEARAYCEKEGAELATTGQLYVAWSKGLDSCNPGWLSDGSVRYPIIIPRERCGGPQAGVKTLYRYSNQTGFPESSSRHDVYCFRGVGNPHTDAPMDYMATEPEDIGQDIVVLMELAEELYLSQDSKQVEREAQSVLGSLPVFQSAPAQEDLQGTPPTALSSTEVPLTHTASSQDLLQPFDETSLPIEENYHSQHATSLPNTSSEPDSLHEGDYHSQHSTSLPSTSSEPESLHERDYHSQNSSSIPSTSSVPDSLHERDYHSQNSSSIPSTSSEPDSLHERDYHSQHSTSLPSTSSEPESLHERDYHSQNSSSIPSTSSVPDSLHEGDYHSQNDISIPSTSSEPDSLHERDYHSQNSSSLPSTSSKPDSLHEGDYHSQNSTSLPSTSSEPVSLHEGDYHSQNSTSLPNTSSEPDSLHEGDYHSQNSTSLPSTSSEPDSLHEGDYHSQNSTSLPSTSSEPVSLHEGDNHSQNSTSLPNTSSEPDSLHEGDYHSQNSTSLPSTSSEPDSLHEGDYHSQNSTSLPNTSSEPDSLHEGDYHSQNSTSLPSTSSEPVSLHEGDNHSHNSTSLPNTSIEPDSLHEGDYHSHNSTSLPNSSSEPDSLHEGEYHSQNSTSLPRTSSVLDSLHEGNSSLYQLVLETTPEFPEPSYEPHRHYQPMPEMNPEETDYQQSGSSKHFQPMPETNLELDQVEANYSTTGGNQSHRENTKETTTMAFEPIDNATEARDHAAERRHKEVIVGEPEETSISTKSPGELDPRPAWSTLSPHAKATSVWSPLDGSGDVSQEIGLVVHQGIHTDRFPTSSSSSSSSSSFTIHMSASPGATSIPSEEQTGVTHSSSILSGLDHSEELGLDVYSTVGHPKVTSQGTSSTRLEGSTSLDFEGIVIPERLVPSREVELAPGESDEEHLGSGEGIDTTESPDLSTTSQLPVEFTTLGYQTTTMSRIEMDPTTTDPEEDGSGHEPSTDEPSLGEKVTVFPLESQTSSWDLHRTTSAPQESLEDLEYSGEPLSTSSQTDLPDSSEEPDLFGSDSLSISSTDPTAATMSTSTMYTSTEWATRTWSPTTSTTQGPPETSEPERVTALMPPVDQGRLDLEFGLTHPPTLLMLPNERAAVGSARKISDACLEDPCSNGGTCVEMGASTKCLCLPSYGGDLCQTDLEQCEVGWQKFHGNCYKHFNQRLSWEVAEQHCRMVGAHLASIMTPEEKDFINNNFKEYQWTGLNDKTIEGDFHWSDGNPLLYENWYRGQPDSYFLSGEDCVVMVWHDSGHWSDVPCNYHLAYTCKKGTSSCGPPPKVRNTLAFGKIRQRYETGAVVRYYCAQGFQQRRNPLVMCLPGGKWEEPQILCIPGAGSTAQTVGVTSLTTGSQELAEEESQTTKETLQYWDIKWNF